ncbi:tryptophan halogenase family protein [uncultured Pseudoalteromonas sp.]|uniref:tryptophan halogenase family protein n=1 Tax=uncultured Pseudoalteromonas sp. TaxID=114053 RepID=UPI002598086A|nr:tryptophan halogenase family protein [uncultured Pseudoalteromonas sp.]|tara:strand:- start:7609 stop:9084 length:1476 start_codon:yes stop_codon:yes gene_type:complete
MNEPYHIAIVGGGTAGWMTACLLKHAYKALNVNVTLIESKNINTIGVGEGSTPTLKLFFDRLGLDESIWMDKCEATHKLNIRFEDWQGTSEYKHYDHPFISQPDVFHERAYSTNCLTRRLGLEVNTKAEDFFLNASLAKENKHPTPSENFPFKIAYGYHFDAAKLSALLQSVAIDLGVKHISNEVDKVICDDGGYINDLIFNDCSTLNADFFIDCTGFSKKLIKQTLNVPSISFSDNLFNDSAIALKVNSALPVKTQTISTALSSGWQWQIPLQNSTGYGYVFSSRYQSADSAEYELRSRLNLIDNDVSSKLIKFETGQLKEHWRKNCLAIGLSQGFIEPLEATGLHLTYNSILRFIKYFSFFETNSNHIKKFNKTIVNEFELTRDYIVAHYKLNQRSDTDYWRDNRKNNNTPMHLKTLIKAWVNNERLEPYISNSVIKNQFSATSWNCLFAGYGQFNQLASEQPRVGDLYKELKIASFIKGCNLNFIKRE